MQTAKTDYQQVFTFGLRIPSERNRCIAFFRSAIEAKT